MTKVGPKIVTDGLEFSFNFETLAMFSQRGIPVVNRVTSTSDYTGDGSNYGVSNWTNLLIRTHEPNIATPAGSGATYFIGNETYGYQMFGRFSASDRRRSSTSYYLYPLGNSITDVYWGLLNSAHNSSVLSLQNGGTTYTNTYPSFEEKTGFEEVEGWPGWYRVWGRLPDRPGGFVPSIWFNDSNGAVGYTESNKPSGYIAGLMNTASPEPYTPYVSGVMDLFDPEKGPVCKIARSSDNQAAYLRPPKQDSTFATTDLANGYDYTLYTHRKRWVEPQSQPFTPGAGDFTFSFKLGAYSTTFSYGSFNGTFFDSDDLDIRITTRNADTTSFMVTIDGAQFYVFLNSGVFDSEGVYYIDMVFDRDGNLEIFIDNQSVGTVDISSKSSYNITAEDMKIFKDVFFNAHFFKYYNRKLTNEEINTNYQELSKEG